MIESQSTWPYWRHTDGRRAELRETTPRDHWTVTGLNSDPEPDVFMGLALALDALAHAGFTPAPIEQLTLDGSKPERIQMMPAPKAQLSLF